MSFSRLVYLLILLYAALVADTVAAQHLAIGGIAPDWCALAVIVWMLRADLPYTPLIGGLAGLAIDLGAPGPVGGGVVALAIAGYCVPRLAHKLTAQFVAAEAVLVGGATFAIGCLFITIALVGGQLDVPLGQSFLHLTGVAMYTSLVSVPLLMIQGWLLGDSAGWRWRHAS